MPAESRGGAGDRIKSNHVVRFGVHAVQPLRRVESGNKLSITCEPWSKIVCEQNRRGRLRELDMDTIAARRVAEGKISCVFDADARPST
jgi:hypothetical protein